MRMSGARAAMVSMVVVTLIGVFSMAQGQSEAEMAEMMKRWQEAATPGEHHKLLERFLGDWEYEMLVWMGGPGSEPSRSKGTSTGSWLMEGRFLQMEGEGDMMGMPGRTFSLWGYDNFKKKYVCTAVDTFNTHMLRMEGSANRDKSEIHMFGPMDEPTTGEHDKTVKYVFRFISDDEHVMEVHDEAIASDNNKVVELRFKRKK